MTQPAQGRRDINQFGPSGFYLLVKLLHLSQKKWKTTLTIGSTYVHYR
jgi:hypothetical protein